jgi:hypothetical protein
MNPGDQSSPGSGFPRGAENQKEAQLVQKLTVVLVMLLSGVVALAGQSVLAQEPNNRSQSPVAPPVIAGHTVNRATSTITVDGVLDEAAWQQATSIALDYEWLPGDNAEPPVETVALLTYDDDALYVAFRASDPNPQEIRAHLMDRDQINTFVQDDHVTLLIDTFNDERRAVQLRVNPLGVQADAIFSEVDGIEDFSWDIIWDSAGRITAHGYEIEIAVPLNQIRFPRTSGVQSWGIEVGRSYPRSLRHRIGSSPRDRNNACLLCQIDKVTGFAGVEPGRNIEIDPTVTVIRTDQRLELPDGKLQPGDEEVEPGVSVRWGVTPNLSLNAAVNPDFSQVEADVAQLEVNERFALFYPEKRPFFLEGIDFFSTPMQAVFTRTVVDPRWGLKLTGKQDRHALGLFVTDDEVNSLIIPSNQGSQIAVLDESVTSGVLRYRLDIGSGSTFGVLYAGREGSDKYHNRVGGVDGFFRLSQSNTLRLQYLHSDTQYPEAIAEPYSQSRQPFSGDAGMISFQHASRSWFANLTYEDYDPGFRADSGFIPRVDVRTVSGNLIRTYWGDASDWYTQVNVGGFVLRSENNDGKLTDETWQLNANLLGPWQSNVGVNVSRSSERLADTLYEQLDRVGVNLQTQPTGSFRITFSGLLGDTLDYSNLQRAELLQLQPAVEMKIGRRVNAKLDHTLQQLDVEGGRLLSASLSQLTLVYHFNVRSFVRSIFQHLDVTRDPGLYTAGEVSPRSDELFTQLLFSYKLNPQTVLFVGYSDRRVGTLDFSLTESDRTFFVKLGYAWIL